MGHLAETSSFGIIVLEQKPSGDFTPPAGKVLFLDRLLLPTSLDLLDINQIEFINRFREENFSADGQFGHVRMVRQHVGQVLAELEIHDLLEVGCGKFPFVDVLNIGRYAAIEIDQVAISECRSRGLDVGAPDDPAFLGSLPKFSTCLALYVFHFSCSEAEVENIAGILLDDSLLLFTVIGEEAGLRMATMFARYGFSGGHLRGGHLSRKERMYILGRGSARAAAQHALNFGSQLFLAAPHA